jgi:alpha-tubulin suppressor-like RCC1 family protein
MNRYIPTRISNFGNIVAVCATYTISMILDANGSIFSFGEGIWGSLGLGDTLNRYVPTQLLSMVNITIVNVSCSQTYCLILTDQGMAWSFGTNAQGQLGIFPPVNKVLVPVWINRLGTIKITKISAGLSHSIIITETGGVYACGGNIKGEQGNGGTSFSIPDLRNIAFLNGLQIEQIVAGFHTSFFYSSVNGLYACGSTDYGQLGLGLSGVFSEPQKVVVLDSIPIEEIGAGADSVARSSPGPLYSFGSNRFGGLGLVDFTPRSSPTEIVSMSGLNFTSLFVPTNGMFLIGPQGVYFSGGNSEGKNSNPLTIRSKWSGGYSGSKFAKQDSSYQGGGDQWWRTSQYFTLGRKQSI